MQAHTLGQGSAPALRGALAGQAHPIDARRRRIAAARFGDEAGLSREGGTSAERFRIDRLDEHRSAPALGRVRPAVARDPLRQRLDRERQAVALVPILAAAIGRMVPGGSANSTLGSTGGLPSASIAQRPGAGALMPLVVSRR